jgi:hypothetical protein
MAPAGVLLADSRGGIRVAGVSRNSGVQAGATFSGNLLFSTGVLAAGSSLVLPDLTLFVASARVDPTAVSLGFKFVVAVPLLFEDVPMGALGLFDRTPRPFKAEDLLILEGIGRDASLVLRHTSPVGRNAGFIPQPLFDHMLGAELSLLHREGGGLELVLVEMEPAVLSPGLALEIQNRGGSRLAICRREAGTLALFKRDSNGLAGKSAVSASLSMLVATGGARATGWVSIVDDGLPLVSQDVVLQLAGFALAQSRSTGRAEQLVLGCTPTLGSAARASHPAGSG